MDESTAPTQSKKTIILILSAVIIAVISAYSGYLLGQNYGSMQSPIQKGEVVVPKMADNSSSEIIVHQSATAVGKVIKVENNTVTLQSDKGIVLGFKVGPDFNIYNPSTASSSGSPKTSKDLKDVTLNQKYVLDMILQNGSYVVTSMNRVPQ